MPGAPVWRNCTCCDWWRPARTWRRISSPSPRPSSKNTPPKSRARNKPRAPRTEPPSPVPYSTLFHFRDRAHQSQVAAILRRLPPVEGAPIAIERARGLSSRGQAVHAGSLLRERRSVFDCTRAEFPRIFVHELFHFVWLRAGNPTRFGWEALLGCELEAGAGGELGWADEWRKQGPAAASGTSIAAKVSATPRPGCTRAAPATPSSLSPPGFAPPAAPGFTKPLRTGDWRYTW